MIQQLYRLIPKTIRESLSPFLSGFFLPVHYMENPNTSAEERLIAVYLGVNEKRAKLWGKRLLGDEFTQTQAGRLWIWSLGEKLDKRLPECDVVLIETNVVTELLLSRYKGFKLPIWAQFNLDLTRPLKDLRKASSKLREQIPRRIRQNSLELEISRDPQDLEEFIETMHMPYIKGRHKDTAFITSKDDIRRVFENSDLLLVKQGGERISGCLLEYMGNAATLHYLGLKDNNPEYLKAGGVGALYYFSILHAKEKGLDELNFGGTSPFLSDGVTFFKLMFKPFVSRISYLDDYFVKFILRKPTDGLASFLKANPFLYLRKGDEFERILFIENSEIAENELDSILKRTYCEKLKKTVLALKDGSNSQRLLEKNTKPDGHAFEITTWDSVFIEQF